MVFLELQVSRLVRSAGDAAAVDTNRQELRSCIVGDDGDGLAEGVVLDVAVADVGLEEVLGEGLGHSRHLVATVRPADRCLIATLHLGVRDGDHRFGRRRAAADHAGRRADEGVRAPEAIVDAVGVAGNVEAPGDSTADRHDHVACEQLSLRALDMIVDLRHVHAIRSTLDPDQLDPDACGHVVLSIERLDSLAELILVDGPEAQCRDQLASGWEALAVAASEPGQDELVLGVVANALHQVVVVDHQRAQSQLSTTEGRRRSGRTTADDECIEDLG